MRSITIWSGRAPAILCTLRQRDQDRHPFSAPLPNELTAPLDHYISVVRPRLLKGQSHARLWVSERGTPMASRTIHEAVTLTTQAAFAAPSMRICSAIVRRPLLRWKTRNTLAWCRLFLAISTRERRNNTTSKPIRLSLAAASGHQWRKRARCCPLPKMGDPHDTRRHLRPLFLRSSVGCLDRRSGPPLPRAGDSPGP